MTHKQRWFRAATAALAICLILSVCGFHGTCEGIRQNAVRLHVLANSDSAADQALKCKVRDAILDATVDWDATTPAEARRLAQESLPRLQAVAEQIVAAEGHDYPVAVEMGRTYFPTRQYDAVTLPAGNYEAVRVLIGAGEGQNWWCVLFPPLCVGAATDRRQATSLWSDSQQDLVENGDRYVVKFKVVEWVQQVLSLFR